jgi:hypothetical protein
LGLTGILLHKPFAPGLALTSFKLIDVNFFI